MAKKPIVQGGVENYLGKQPQVVAPRKWQSSPDAPPTELLTNPLVLEESEALKIQAADANELHVIASILEIQPREVTT